MNSSKTKVTVFGNRKIDASKFSFTCNGEELEIVHNFKYLGIIFNFNGAFKIGITELKKQASRAMFALISKCRKFDLPIDIRLELFDSLVMPVMLYASEVWGGEHTGILETLHLKFLKYTLRVKTSTCNNMVYGELGRFPLVIDIQKRLIGYWARLITGKSTKLSKVMYDCLLHLYSAGIYESPWLLRIKQILDTCGLSYVWQEQSNISIEWLKLTVERRLKDIFIQQWESELRQMTSCDLYVEFKREFRLEKYLLSTDGKYRQAICNFRTNNTRIPKVTGRYQNIERKDRVCTICSLNRVGDEYHLLFECNNTDIVNARVKFLPEFYINHPSVYKLLILLNSDKLRDITKLGAFLKNTLELYR